MSHKWYFSIMILSLIWCNFYFPIRTQAASQYNEILQRLSQSTNYLINSQAENGLFLPSDMEMTVLNTYTFLHSYIFDALLDVHATPLTIPNEVITKAQNYLMDIRYEECWNYSTDMPPDTDDSAIAAIALQRSGLAPEYLNQSFSKLNSSLTAEGYSKFWITTNATLYMYYIYNNTYSNYTGNLFDSIYLTAGTLYALYLFDYRLYKTEIDHSVALLESKQSLNGSWICKYWYPGAYYGTFLCSRLITSVKPNSPTLPLAYNFLLSTQHFDGGWGRNVSSNPLDTSFALIALHYLHQIGLKSETAILNGIGYLKSVQYSNGTYPEVTLWTSYPNSYYQGKSLTTLFVIKALSLNLGIFQDANLLRKLIFVPLILSICLSGLYWFFLRKSDA
ncbi:MAG: hypothetical protein ACTSQI_06760 [Candidatus Helarchaeota archaeon]